MDYDLPSWLTDDLVRRRKARKLARRKRILAFIGHVLLLITLSALFGALLFGAYSIRFAEPIVYVAPQIVEAQEVTPHKTVVATITAYTSSVDETDDTPFETASGAQTGEGVIACPPKYDFGTQVVIEGRQYTCEDRMNRRYHNQERFDIWVETKDEAFDWGVRELEIKVLAYGER